ncbi:MAG: class III signal peptide-containing protein [Candidatus Omnitrophota bacterium]
MLRNKKGQSTLEYIILVTGVIVVLLAVAGNKGFFSTALETTLNQATDGMTNMATRLRDSRP